MPPSRLVLDTNAALDLWFFDDPAARGLRAAIESGRLGVIGCAAAEAELGAVLRRPPFSDDPRAAPTLSAWRATVSLLPDLPNGSAPWHCADPDDQKFLDLAHAGRAGWLVTKDRALLRLARRARERGLAIVPPQLVR